MTVRPIVVLLGAIACATLPLPASAADPGYLTSQFFWRADGGFDGWERGAGTTRTGDGRLALDTATDTLVVADGKPAADALQVKVRLMTARPDAVPSLTFVAVAVSTTPPKATSAGSTPPPAAPGEPARWGKILDVPACTQSYPDGGEGWCSPTSISMIVGYWAHDTGPCEPRVRAAVDGVYDWIYDGHGNWPFNTAYAAARGLEAYVTRFRSLADAEPWIAAGVPVG